MPLRRAILMAPLLLASLPALAEPPGACALLAGDELRAITGRSFGAPREERLGEGADQASTCSFISDDEGETMVVTLLVHPLTPNEAPAEVDAELLVEARELNKDPDFTFDRPEGLGALAGYDRTTSQLHVIAPPDLLLISIVSDQKAQERERMIAIATKALARLAQE